MRVAIVDYGMGNIKSISSTLDFLGVDDVVLTNNFEELKSCDKLILPGVGSFKKAMIKIFDQKIDEKLFELVIIKKKHVSADLRY